MIAITTLVTDDEVLVISRAFLVRPSFSVQCLVLLSWTFLPLSMIVHFNLISRLRICFFTICFTFDYCWFVLYVDTSVRRLESVRGCSISQFALGLHAVERFRIITT